jgi:sortase (surface protein transpeptidase)
MKIFTHLFLFFFFIDLQAQEDTFDRWLTQDRNERELIKKNLYPISQTQENQINDQINELSDSVSLEQSSATENLVKIPALRQKQIIPKTTSEKDLEKLIENLDNL